MARPRFTLRALLMTVAVCALGAFFYARLPNYVTRWELDQLASGMPIEEVRGMLGEPDRIDRGENGEDWFYGVYVVVQFDRHGKLIGWDDW